METNKNVCPFCGASEKARNKESAPYILEFKCGCKLSFDKEYSNMTVVEDCTRQDTRV